MKSVNFFSVIAAELRPKAALLVRRTAIDVVFRARAHSRVDTGAMRDAWTYEIESDGNATVSNDSDHVLPNEYGTSDGKVSAQPMLHPALDEARPDFESGLARLFEP